MIGLAARQLGAVRSGGPHSFRGSLKRGAAFEHDLRAAIGEHEGAQLGRIFGIERHVGAAGEEHAKDIHDGLDGAIRHDGDGRFRPHTEGAEAGGQSRGSLVQRAIGERLAAAADGGGIRLPRRLRGDEGRHESAHGGSHFPRALVTRNANGFLTSRCHAPPHSDASATGDPNSNPAFRTRAVGAEIGRWIMNLFSCRTAGRNRSPIATEALGTSPAFET